MYVFTTGLGVSSLHFTDTSYLLVSAATTLLRRLVEAGYTTETAETRTKIVGFMQTLKLARNRHGWELAQLCIETCGKPIEQLASASSSMSQSIGNPATSNTAEPIVPPPHSVFLDETFAEPSLDANILGNDMAFAIDLDIPWDHLWDDMAEPWRFGDAQHDF